MANNSIQFSHPYPATARLFQQACLARLARASFASVTAQLSPTEGDLLTAGIGKHVIPLNTDWPNILGDLFSLGKIRMITTGACAFIEKYGVYPQPEFSDSQVTIFDNQMKIAIDLAHWGHAFAVFPVADGKASLTGCGLHFFDRSGTAMHRIFLSSAGSIEAFERIAEEYHHCASNEPRSNVPRTSLQLTDSAGSTLRHGSEKVVRRVQSYELLRALHNCQQAKLPIRISIGTAACTHTHTGFVRDIQGSPFWTCAVGDDTIVYIRDAEIAETHIVEANRGEIRSMSLCAFDAQGRAVAALGVEETESQIFSHRWNHWLESLSDI